MICLSSASLDPAAILVAGQQILARRPSLTLFLISMGLFAAAAVLQRRKQSRPPHSEHGEQKIPAATALEGSSYDT